MSVRYLLDTNIASYAIKGNFPQVRHKLLRTPMSEIGISVVTEAELRFGAAKMAPAPKLELAVEEFLMRVEILPWSSESAKSYAKLRAELEGRGQPVGNLDLMIAAQAIVERTTLVTNDRVFARIKTLRLEDWTKA
jgi:tRNA(fMet)-specific endonuclease VapC